MRLSQLYSNQPNVFGPIRFRQGLNVVLGEIRRPDDRDQDTHNLGKTLLAQVIDFCLLREKKKNFFLFQHQRRFQNFVFFLEIETPAGEFVTLRRSVERGSKASLIRHASPRQNLAEAPEEEWDHWEAPFATAKQLLDGLLELRAISPWTFRQALAYSLRSQKDYIEPFKLAKFAGTHEQWKPLLAHILGLNASLIERHYRLNADIEEEKKELVRQEAELHGVDDRDQLRGLLTIRQQEVERYEHQLQEYDFELADAEINRELVDDLDARISDLNERRYYLDAARKRTEESLQERVDFDIGEIQRLFEQSSVYFGDQLVRDYEDLLAFNRAISEERNEYLSKELESLRSELDTANAELHELNAKRSAALVVLKDREAFSKFRQLSQKLVDKKAALESLHRQEAAFDALVASRHRLHELALELAEVRDAIEEDLKNQSDRYQAIRSTFNEIVSTVIDQNANLYVSLNTSGNPEFHADLVDEHGQSTSAGDGHTYGRLLCIAFDLAVQHAYLNEAYPHFVYHDGLLETLDNRKKLNLIDVARAYAEAGVQHIVTVIDSELPQLPDGSRFEFERDEVILLLHDEDASGRLFRMPDW